MSVRAFASLVTDLAATTSSSRRVERLILHLREAAPPDAALAAWFLLGNRLRRAVKVGELRAWVAEEANLSEALVAACHDHVGDLAETLALLVPDPPVDAPDVPLDALVEHGLRALAPATPTRRREIVLAQWSRLDRASIFAYHKLLTGAFRVGVARGLVVRAIAAALEVDEATLDDRLAGGFEPTQEGWLALARPLDPAETARRPRPFQLAQALPEGAIAGGRVAAGDDALLEGGGADLGPVDRWLVEPKWDGARAQLLRRGDPILWSRGEGRLDGSFPEVLDAARSLPPGCVLDGEVLLWAGDRPRPFSSLQRRLGIEHHAPGLFDEDEARFVAFDLLELAGEDIRSRPLGARRAALESLLARLDPKGSIRLSERLRPPDWAEADLLRRGARERGVEGLMLKRLDAPYEGGRPRGSWWKWKVDPRVIDAVLVHAQAGHGRRAGLLTDYTLALRDGESLVPVAKAYSGLSDAELVEVDRILRRTIVGRRGPVRIVEPSLVFEIAFEGVQRSSRHRSGLAVRFPRILRWRRDKTPADADALATLAAMADADRRSEP